MPIPNQYYQNRYAQHAFTLVEMMVVVVILSIFAGMMTLSVGSSEARKNRAFYEHLQDSLSYLRLVSAERMQPLGVVINADASGQARLQAVALTNAYAPFEQTQTVGMDGDSPKNNMELSAMSSNSTNTPPTPTWQPVDIDLPEIPPNVTIRMSSLDAGVSSSQPVNAWFVEANVPEVVWFGTGEASPVQLEVLHNNRPVGDAIVITPDGRVKTNGERLAG